ncbi:hypothetical protein [Mycoplasma sp. HU2014]|uniref:hypothetical protein n=1 Tax=Mycoplasma sp. HU2014 TaxID=1664275 RepID=UPI00067CEB01|nr:hypothetical protein [Mycoplasma sp. HU2014]KNG79778.1 hypothetical protein AB668_02200 [Mycoplasma sp. HU2014]
MKFDYEKLKQWKDKLRLTIFHSIETIYQNKKAWQCHTYLIDDRLNYITLTKMVLNTPKLFNNLDFLKQYWIYSSSDSGSITESQTLILLEQICKELELDFELLNDEFQKLLTETKSEPFSPITWDEKYNLNQLEERN